MRRILLFLLVLTGSLLITSCLTIEERITLNADGSGTQTNTIDFSEMLSNPMIKMGLAEEMKKQGGSDVPQRVDSTFSIYDGMIASNPQWTPEERDLVRRASGSMVMDMIEGEGVVTTTFDFDAPEQISQFAQVMADANKPEGGDDANPFAGMSGQDFLLSTLTLKKGKLTRTAVQAPGFENPLAAAGLDESTGDMMKEMFGDAVMIYVMEFPGKIKKVSGFPGHEITNDNEVVMLIDFNEMLDDPEVVAKLLTGEVKFKK